MRTADGFLNHGLGDWGNPENILVRENVETAFLYADSRTMAYFAGILGKEEEQAAFEALAEEIRKIIMKNFWYSIRRDTGITGHGIIKMKSA